MIKTITIYLICLAVFLVGIVLALYLKNIIRSVKRKKKIRSNATFKTKFYGKE